MHIIEKPDEAATELRAAQQDYRGLEAITLRIAAYSGWDAVIDFIERLRERNEEGRPF